MGWPLYIEAIISRISSQFSTSRGKSNSSATASRLIWKFVRRRRSAWKSTPQTAPAMRFAATNSNESLTTSCGHGARSTYSCSSSTPK